MFSSEALFTIKYSRGEKEVHKLPHNLEDISNFQAPNGRHKAFSVLRTKIYYKVLWHGEQEPRICVLLPGAKWEI